MPSSRHCLGPSRRRGNARASTRRPSANPLEWAPGPSAGAGPAAVPLAVTVPLPVGDAVALPVAVAVPLRVAGTVALPVAVPVPLALPLGVPLSVPVAVSLDVADSVAVGRRAPPSHPGTDRLHKLP